MRRWGRATVFILAAGCSGSESTPPLDDPSQDGSTVMSVVVSPTTTMIAVGEIATFTAQATLVDGTTIDVTSASAWSSSDDGVATIRANSEFRGVGEGTAIVSAVYRDVTGTAALTVDPSPLTGLELFAQIPSFEVGQTLAVRAVGAFADGSSSDVSGSVDWSSSDDNIATVMSGQVTGVSPGMVTITASRDGISATLNLTVVEPRVIDLAVRSDGGNLPTGETRPFTAEAMLSNGSTADLTAQVVWSTNDPAVATVSAAGLVTAVGEGLATITALHEPSGFDANRDIRVTPPALVQVTVRPDAVAADAGDFIVFAAIGEFSDGSTENFTRRVSWRSSDTSVVTVTNDPISRGRAQALGAGTAVVSVVDEETGLDSDTSSTSAMVTVRPPQLRSVQVEPRNATTPAGRTFQFSARGNFSDGSSQILPQVEWSTGNPTIATIDQNGLATGLEPGTAQIRALDPVTGIGSGSLTGSLEVTEAVLEQLRIEPSNPVLAFDETRQIDAIGTFSDGSEASVRSRVSWTSNNTAVIVAAGGGTLRAVSAGTATITARDVGTQVQAQITATVQPLILLRIVATPSRLVLPPGAEAEFSLEAQFNNGAVEDVTDTVSYTNANPTAVERGTSGNLVNRLLALNVGRSTITARDARGVSTTIDVTVSSTLALGNLEISLPSNNLPRGATDQLRALGTYNSGDVFDLTHGVTWASSATPVASISNVRESAGQITGVAIGTATITARRSTTISPAQVVTVVRPEATGAWNGPTATVDGTGSSYVQVGFVDFSAQQFGNNARISEVRVTVDFLKTDGTCASPGPGNPFHGETTLRLLAPSGQRVLLASAGTWSGTVVMGGSVAVTFDDTANAPPSGTPVAGTFQPNGGSLSGFNTLNPVGRWVLEAGDTAGGDPLCVNAYSVAVSAR